MISEPMMQRLEGEHVGLLWQVKRKKRIVCKRGMIVMVNTDPFLMLLLTNSRREITKRKNLTTNAP